MHTRTTYTQLSLLQLHYFKKDMGNQNSSDGSTTRSSVPGPSVVRTRQRSGSSSVAPRRVMKANRWGTFQPKIVQAKDGCIVWTSDVQEVRYSLFLSLEGFKNDLIVFWITRGLPMVLSVFSVLVNQKNIFP
jgi:hypothetical protein